MQNISYRNDLATIQNCGFHLVRLYNWNMARGSTAIAGPSPDHVNFLDRANALGLQVVVPVSDYFLGDSQYAWKGQSPDAAYSFGSAPQGVQNDFNLFVLSITDPRTNQIHAAVHSVSVGNEGDIGQGIQGTTPSNFLARTIWWIANLRRKTASIGPNMMLSATFSNADQGGGVGCWFNCLINGVNANQPTPNGGLGTIFGTAVTGLSNADSNYAAYYYNSTNISQVSPNPPYQNTLAQTAALYDQGTAPWPRAKFNVPLLFMEVFTPNRTAFSTQTDQATAAVGQARSLEAYLKKNNAGTPFSTTNLMGYNYFEFNDEQQVKLTGLFGYASSPAQVHTGTTSTYFGGFPDFSPLPVHGLAATAGPTGSGVTLWQAWEATFPTVTMSGTIVAAFGAPGDWQATFYAGTPVPAGIKPGMFASGPGIPPGAIVLSAPPLPMPTMTVVMVCRSNAATNPFTANPGTVTLTFRG